MKVLRSFCVPCLAVACVGLFALPLVGFGQNPPRPPVANPAPNTPPVANLAQTRKLPKPVPVSLKTRDGVQIAATYYASPLEKELQKDAAAVILLHAYKGSRGDFNDPAAANAAQATPAAAQRSGPRSYTVQAGDNLVDIARKMYGDGRKHEVLFQANRRTMKTPADLKVGAVLIVP